MEQKQLTGYPSIDKPWLQYYSEEAINAPLPECTVYQNIWQHNKDHLGDIALEFYGHKTTYGKLFEQTERCAKALKAAGVNPGDCVNLCTAGVPEAVYLVLACSKIGAIANFINPMFTTEQMIDRINDTEADLLIVLDKMYSYIANAIDKTCVKHVVIIPATGSLPAPVRALAALKGKPDVRLKAAMQNASKYWTWRAFTKAGETYTGITEEPYRKDTPVIMVYSSGTTGASKGIVLTNDGVNSTISYYLTPDFLYERGNTFLQMIPVWFSTGIVLSVLMPLCLGVTVIPELIFSKESFAKDIAKHCPNMTLAATSLWVYAMQSKELASANLAPMRYPITGGEQVLPQIEEEINAFLAQRHCFARLLKGWGMCELGSTITASTPIHNKPGSTGYPISNVVVSAFDIDTGEELPIGKRGELRVVSPSRMKEYYRNKQAASEFFHTDENGIAWGCTGDIGYIDEDGDVFVLGRASDCFYTPNNERIYLFDAEHVILRDPSIALCKMVNMSIHGQSAPVAHFVLKADNTGNEIEIIRRLDRSCRASLPDAAVPKYYKERNGFPVHSNGKRDVEALKAERDGFVDAEGCAVDFAVTNERGRE